MNQHENYPMVDLLPHRDPMVLIDEAWAETEDIVHGTRTFRPGDFGVSGDRVGESLLIECLAQLVGALRGINAIRTGGKQSPGFLVKVKVFEYSEPLTVGEKIILRAQITHRLGDFIKADVRAESKSGSVGFGTLQFYVGQLPKKNANGS